MSQQLAFTDVVVEPHVTEVPVEDHVSTSGGGAHDEASGGNTSALPTYLYVSHPSQQCENTGNHCPAVSGAAVGWTVFAVIAVIVLIVGLIAYTVRDRY